jgi:hypothetical protein
LIYLEYYLDTCEALCGVDAELEELISNLLNPLWPIKDILDDFFKGKK